MTLYTKQGFCPGCMMSKKVLNSIGAKYTIKHLTAPSQKEYVKDLGFRSYPIVCPNDTIDKDTFAGFRPELLRKYALEK